MTSQAEWDELKSILADDYAPVGEDEAKEKAEFLMGLYEALFGDGAKTHEV